MKNYFFLLLCCIALGLTGIAYCNWQIDLFGILKGDFSEKRLEPDQHFIKMRYILNNPGKYNAFAFGASRVGRIPTYKIADGCRWYNMSYSEGMPAEWLSDVRMMLDNGVTIRKLLIGIDDASFRVDAAGHQGFQFRRPYTKWDWKFYLSNLFMWPEFSDPKIVEEKGCVYDIYNSGLYFSPWVDAAIEADPVKHAQNATFSSPYVYQTNRMEKALLEIAALKKLAVEHGIEIIFFIHPLYKVTYLANNQDELDSFKRELAKITAYYDFSGLNAVTTNSFYYYESSHYRHIVGDMIIRRIFKGDSTGPLGGVYVTSGTVEEHIKTLRDGIAAWSKQHS